MTDLGPEDKPADIEDEDLEAATGGSVTTSDPVHCGALPPPVTVQE